jgi:hypothetical protein
MPARRLTRMLAATAAVAAAATATVATATAGPSATAAQAPTIKITPKGVGAVKVGATFQELRDGGLVGRMGQGCELAGPGTRAAQLKRPLRGGVDFTRNGTARVRNITVTKGAAARGVGIGDTAAALRAAFPGARFDHGTDDTFGFTVVHIPKKAGGRLAFAVDVDSQRVELIGVPFIALCD